MTEKQDRAETAIFVAFEEHSCEDPSYAEKSLMAAILRSVFDDLKKSGREFREARDYVLSNDVEYVYSFKNVCLHLGLCFKTIRNLIGRESLASDSPQTTLLNKN